MIYFNSQKGYTLLFAVIVSSIVLSIGAFILSISRKQFILSSAARDSTIAVYAADSGIQCAIQEFISTDYPTPSGININPGKLSKFNCNSTDYSTDFKLYDVSLIDTTMNFRKLPGDSVFKTDPVTIYLSNGSCANVTFFSGISTKSNQIKTYIESRGYNMGKESNPSACPVSNNPRVVERALYVAYE